MESFQNIRTASPFQKFYYLYLHCALASNLIWRHENILSFVGICFFDSRTAIRLCKLCSFLIQFILELCLYHFYYSIIKITLPHSHWILRKYCSWYHAGEINTLHWMHYPFLSWSFSSSFAYSAQRLLWIRFNSNRLQLPVLLYSKSQIHLETLFNKFHVGESLLKVQDFQRSKDLPVFPGDALFFTMYTRALHWLLSWARRVHYTPAHSISLRVAFNIILPSTSGVFYLCFPTKMYISAFRFPATCATIALTWPH